MNRFDFDPPAPVLISDRAKQTPDATAIELIDTNQQLSWRDLDSSCRRWADAYRRLKLTSGDCVITLMPNTLDAFYAWLGCAWLRAIEVPVNTDLRGDWLTHAINTPRARIIVISHRFLASLTLVADQLQYVNIVVVYDADHLGDEEHALERFFHIVTGEEFFAHAEPAYDLVDPQPWDIMTAVYTSGTTGRAKAVMQPWGIMKTQTLTFSPPEFQNAVFYHHWPPYHTLGKSLLIVPGVFGGKVAFRERFSIQDYWNDVREHGCTAAFTVSVIASFLYDQPPRDDDAENPLEAVLMGPVIPQVDDFKRRFDVNVYTTFGSSEIGAAFYSFPREVNGSNWKSCGRVVPDAPNEVAIVDEHDLPVGPGVTGELIVRPKGPWTVNAGYLNMPEETVRAWRNGWFHTGDAFVYDEDGEYYFVDRVRDYIRRRGENISSFEVESAVCAYRGVAQAAAVAVPAEVGEDEVMVFVLPEPGATVEPSQLAAFLTDRVPAFAMPRYIEVTDSLPATQATFRVQKHKLRERGPGERTFDRMSSHE